MPLDHVQQVLHANHAMFYLEKKPNIHQNQSNLMTYQ